MKLHNGLLHVASTSNDKVVRINKDLELVSVDSIENRDLIPCDEWVNDKLHFNSLCWLPNGDEIHVYNGLHMVYNFTKKEIIYQGVPLHSPHDIVFFGDSLVVNSSANYETVQIKNGKAKVIFSVSPCRVKHVNGNQWGYTRGLTSIGNRLFICNSPMRILELKYDNDIFNRTKRVELFEGNDKSIYDICLDPRDWRV
jgi:hypothetical protein